MDSLHIFLGLCALLQTIGALVFKRPLFQLFGVIAGGLLAIAIFQLIAYLDLGYLDPFFMIAIFMQLLYATGLGCGVFVAIAIFSTSDEILERPGGRR